MGDNLATYIWAVTHRGMVVDGAIRDLEGIFPIPMGAYYRGVHPTPISKELMITGINVPIRIGNATVMPGDVVFGDREGVYFVPPHLVTKVLNKADETHIHDEWTRDKFINQTSKYKSSEIYGTPQDPEVTGGVQGVPEEEAGRTARQRRRDQVRDHSQSGIQAVGAGALGGAGNGTAAQVPPAPKEGRGHSENRRWHGGWRSHRGRQGRRGQAYKATGRGSCAEWRPANRCHGLPRCWPAVMAP